MTPPLEKKQEALLSELYYKKGMSVGRDKLFKYLCENYKEYGISRRQVNDWLQNQETHQLNQEHTKPTTIKSSIYYAPYDAIAIDLIDMSNFEIKGYKYLLNGVDLFSRFLYSIPMKNKEDTTTLTAFKKIMKINKFKSVRSDNGSEFVSDIMKAYCKKQKIKQVFSSPHLPQSNGAIERQNGTLKRLIFKQIQINENYDWAKNINTLTNNLNNTIIRQFQKTPIELQNAFSDLKNEANKKLIEKTHTKEAKYKANTILKQRFKVKDKVRIFIPSTDRMKSLQWSKDVYEVVKVYTPQADYSAYQYKLAGLSKRFLEQDLQKISDVQNEVDSSELFEVSKIVKPLIHQNERYFEIAWKGYRNQNSIEPRDELMKNIPKLIHKFEKKHFVKWMVGKRNNKITVHWNQDV